MSFLAISDMDLILCHSGYLGCDMDTEARQRINENGRLVIPAAFRKALGIEIGDEVVLRLEDDELRITTLRRRLQQAQQRVRRYIKPGRSLSSELIAERREAAERE